MPDFKFAKGFFIGMIVADAIISTGLLYLCYKTLKPSRASYSYRDFITPAHISTQYPIGRYNNYAEYYKHERDKKFL